MGQVKIMAAEFKLGVLVDADGVPYLETAAYEAQALTIMQLLTAKKPTIALKPEDRKKVEAIVAAFKAGQKAKVLQLNAEFYKQILPPERVVAAYYWAKAQQLAPNSDFQIVMDSLKEHCAGQELPQAIEMGAEEALTILLLAITQSDKNSISYTRIDEQTGKARPTTFPLTEQLIRNFLLPFGDYDALLRRVLYVSKLGLIGNPAAPLAQRYLARKRAYEEAKAAYEQARQPQEPAKPVIPVLSKPAQDKKQLEIRYLSDELERLLEGLKEVEEQKAVINSFQVGQLKQLLKHSQNQATDFGKQLEKVYTQGLSPAQASQLSARLSSRMKRMMVKLGNWKEEYWQEYQSLMQSLGVWEGNAWLEKWRAGKQGKQHLAKSGKDYLVEEKPQTVEDLLDQADKIKDKLKGKHMLAPGELLPWMTQEPSKAPPEQQRILQALSRSERIDELIQLAIAPEIWAATPAALSQEIYRVLMIYSESDLDRIKAELLKAVPAETLELAKQRLAELELMINKMAGIVKKDFKLTFVEVVKILKAQKTEAEQRERLNSKEYLNSPAAQYSRYQG